MHENRPPRTSTTPGASTPRAAAGVNAGAYEPTPLYPTFSQRANDPQSRIAEIEANIERLQTLNALTVHWPSREVYLRGRRRLLGLQAELLRLLRPELFAQEGAP